MAATDFAQLDEGKVRVWSLRIWKQGRDASFWFSKGFVGKSMEDMNSPIYRVTELTKTSKGDQAVMQMVLDLEEDGIVDDNKLEDNEEAISPDAQIIKISMLRHAVRSRGKMSEQKVVIRFRATGREQLGFWIADRMDELGFLTASGVSYATKLDGTARSDSQWPQLAFAADVAAPTSDRVIYAGAATGTGDIVSTEKMNWNLIVEACAHAQHQKIRPIKAGGRDYYAIVLSTQQRRDLVLDNTYQTLTSKAMERSVDHPLFSGAMATVDGVVLHHHNKVYNTLGASSGSKWGAGGLVDGAQALLFGAQALGMATINEPEYEEEAFDYKNRSGIAVGRQFGLLKPRFRTRASSTTRQDYGLVSIYTAASRTL